VRNERQTMRDNDQQEPNERAVATRSPRSHRLPRRLRSLRFDISLALTPKEAPRAARIGDAPGRLDLHPALGENSSPFGAFKRRS
jgi:hypothetical protein